MESDEPADQYVLGRVWIIRWVFRDECAVVPSCVGLFEFELEVVRGIGMGFGQDDGAIKMIDGTQMVLLLQSYHCTLVMTKSRRRTKRASQIIKANGGPKVRRLVQLLRRTITKEVANPDESAMARIKSLRALLGRYVWRRAFALAIRFDLLSN